MTTFRNVLRLLCCCLVALLAIPCVSQATINHLRLHQISTGQGFALHTVKTIAQDKQGYLWLGSQDGAYRYDGYKFKVYRHNPRDPHSLATDHLFATLADSRGRFWLAGFSSSISRYDADKNHFINYALKPGVTISSLEYRVLTLAEDSRGTIWAGTINGLFSVDVETGKTRHYYHEDKNPHSLAGNVISALYPDQHGNLWIGTQFNGLSRLNVSTGQFETIPLKKAGHKPYSNLHITTIVEDDNNTLWLGTQQGLIAYNRSSGNTTHYTYSSHNPQSLGNNNINHLLFDANNRLWIATTEGLTIFNPETREFTSYYKDPVDSHSLSSDYILFLFEDNARSIWIGTKTGGLNRFDSTSPQFDHIKPLQRGTDGLLGTYVYAIYEDRNNHLWFGSSDGGLTRYDPVNQVFERFHHNPDDPHSLSSRDLRDITETIDGTLWVATNTGGLCKFNRRTRTFKCYLHDPKNSNSLSHNSIIALQADRNGDLWIGTRGGGLNRFAPDTETFIHYRNVQSDPHSISSDTIWSLAIDHDNVLWVGTADAGLNRFDRNTNTFQRYQHNDDNPDSIAADSVMVLFVDSRNRLWVSTFAYGLDMYDKKNARFIHHTTANGMSNNTIYGMLEEADNVFWISSNAGLSRYDATIKQFEHYNANDGLQGDEFNANAALKTRSGKFYFGGVNGINTFYPDEIQRAATFSPLTLTEFRVFNRLIEPGNEATGPTKTFTLSKAIGATKTITLTHKENLFSFDFSSLEFINPGKILYRYKLEGWDEQWIHTDADTRRATYTNIPGGSYTFKVMASNSMGQWSEDSTREINVNILPPPWKSNWAYVGYLMFLVAIATIIWQWVAEKNNARHKQIELEKSMEYSTKLKQLDKLKDEFLANTSHELRTPLNGIIGLSELLLDGLGHDPDENEKEYLQLIIHSGKRLSHLVNDILDYSKLKSKSSDLQTSNVNLHTITEMVLTILRPTTAGSDLQLINLVDPELPAVKADENRLQQILHNLVGNAIKFTESGFVEVLAQPHAEHITIEVKDSGIGISEENQERIFDYFEQADGGTTRSYSGTGIGLAITKTLVQLHGSDLKVESREGIGSTFIFDLAIAENTTDQHHLEDIDPQHTTQPHTSQNSRFCPQSNLPTNHEHCADQHSLSDEQSTTNTTILVVDDNVVNRKVITRYLKLKNYCIVEAAGGREALDIFESGQTIDLVLLDIMMPAVSGFDVCQAIRQAHSREALPVIFLTASSSKSDLVKSFSVGGNDFLNKPVDRVELLSRIKIHLSLIKKYRQKNLNTITCADEADSAKGPLH